MAKKQPSRPQSNHRSAAPAARTVSASAKPTATAKRAFSLPGWQSMLVVLALTAACYMPTVSYKFVNWDDDPNIVENPNLEVLDGQSLYNIFTIDKGAVIGNYNPLPIFTFYWEKKLVKAIDKPTVQLHNVIHFNNVLLHLLAVLLAMRVLSSLGIGTAGTAFGGLLFGLHPMRVESVAWATERKDVLFAVFFFAALFYYIRYAKQRQAVQSNIGLYALIVVLALLACFAKVQAVTLVLSMLLVDYWFQRPFTLQSVVVEKLPFWVMSLIFGLINVYTLKMQGSINDDQVTTFHFGHRLAIGAYSFLYYLYKLILPYPMVPLYSYPRNLPLQILIAPIGFLAFWAAVWYFLWRKGRRVEVFGILFFFFNVMFLLQVLGAGQGFKADRFTYVPYFGFFAIAAWYFDRYSQDPKWRTLLRGGALILAVVYAGATVAQSSIWKDGDLLWSHVMKHEKDGTALPYWNRGQFHRDNQDFDKALADFDRGLAIDTKNVELLNSRAKTYFDMALSGKFPARTQELAQKSIEDYTKGIESPVAKDKTKAEMLINRGAAYGFTQQLPKAMEDINNGLAIDPNNKNGYLNRSLVYFNMGQFEKTIEDYTKYLTYDPNNANIYYERGMLNRSMKRPQQAIPDLEHAIKLNPGLGLAYLEMARAQAMSGNKGLAQQYYMRAQQMGIPQNAMDAQLMQ